MNAAKNILPIMDSSINLSDKTFNELLVCICGYSRSALLF